MNDQHKSILKNLFKFRWSPKINIELFDNFLWRTMMVVVTSLHDDGRGYDDGRGADDGRGRLFSRWRGDHKYRDQEQWEFVTKTNNEQLGYSLGQTKNVGK